jgi:O-antigen/teichoic acid export membrane protein
LNDIDKKIAQGAIWMVAFKLIDRCLGLVSTVVLARLLMPADFGLVAIAMVLISALQLLIAFSFDVPLIQNPNAGREHFDTAWTFNVMFSLLAAAIMGLLAHPAALFYSDARLEAVIYVLALGFAIQGFSNIGPVIFRRDMRFDREFKFLMAKRLTMLGVTIPLALWLRNYWALALSQLVGTLVSVALSFIVSEYRPRFCLQARAELFHSSKWLVINNVLQFLNGNVVQFFIGRLAGPQSLGYYNIAYEISTLPTTELVAPINRAAFPGYSRVAHDTAQLRSSFLNTIAMIAIFALPAGAGIVMVADLLVPVALGWKWLPVVALMQILAVHGVIQALQTNIVYIYLATGRLKVISATLTLQFAVLLACMLTGLHYLGTVGAAWASLAATVLMIPVNQTLVARALQLSSADFLRQMLRPLLAALAMAALLWGVKRSVVLPADTAAYGAMLAACVAGGALAYAGALYLLWRVAGRPPGAEHTLLSQARTRLARLGIHLPQAG